MTRPLDKEFFRDLYRGFSQPLCDIDCGLKCGPHHDFGVPLCCDIHQVVPAAYDAEWRYLEENTTLWTPWMSAETADQVLEEDLQDGQVLLQCKGYQECQREYRTLTCRAFPFFPYLTSAAELRGMSYYPDFRSGCWIISNLDVVSQTYKEAFQVTYQHLFVSSPASQAAYASFSEFMRDKAAEENEKIILLDFSGPVYAIDPRTEEEYQVEYKELSAFGPFAITRELRFPDE